MLTARTVSGAFRRPICFAIFLGWALVIVTKSASCGGLDTDWIDIDSIPLEDYLPAASIERRRSLSTLSDADLARTKRNLTRFRVKTPEGEGPFPAIFFLHGCGGVLVNHYESWASWFLPRGYAFVVIDGWGRRGFDVVCKGGNRLLLAARIGDAYATLYRLAADRERFHIDPTRVFLAGFSNGGDVALDGMRLGLPQILKKTHGSDARFAGSIVFYPHCRNTTRPPFYNPVVIMIGAEDSDANPPACQKWAATPAPPGSAALAVHVFANAHHAFDFPALIFGSTSYGIYQEYSPAARSASEEVIARFLDASAKAPAIDPKAAERIRGALLGNTLRMTMPNGSRALQYFDSDGRAPLAVLGGATIPDVRWRVNEDGRLCRSRPKDGREICLLINIDNEVVTLSSPNGQKGQRAMLLKGNQLPNAGSKKENAPAPTASK